MKHSKNPLLSWLIKLKTDYKKLAIIVMITIFGNVGLYFGYEAYYSYREARAHRALVESLEYFSAQVKQAIDEVPKNFAEKIFPNEKDKWQSTAAAFKRAYDENSSSNIASFFLLYQSEALKNFGDLDKSIDVLKQALSLMPKSELRQAYEIKLALMKVDSSDQIVSKQGLEKLKSIASDDSNIQHDFVLYQLGEYHWTKKEFDQVKNYWKMLMLKYGKGEENPSPWISLIKNRLKLIESA